MTSWWALMSEHRGQEALFAESFGTRREARSRAAEWRAQGFCTRVRKDGTRAYLMLLKLGVMCGALPAWCAEGDDLPLAG